MSEALRVYLEHCEADEERLLEIREKALGSAKPELALALEATRGLTALHYAAYEAACGPALEPEGPVEAHLSQAEQEFRACVVTCPQCREPQSGVTVGLVLLTGPGIALRCVQCGVSSPQEVWNHSIVRKLYRASAE